MGARLRKLWWTYGPTFQWRTFRLHGDPPNGAWRLIRITQICGGRNWSLAITQTGPVQNAPDQPRTTTTEEAR
ncbi:hypothetical protein [Catenuloplanes indicus]|uniref:Uncharacterized protein n=1 Tax=Catenuloplanes indicus TaxID=137267 RepID=A0AAE4AUY8_9ACTN|nr:hypothetical protein [Catenuloplanes indicus]MDQ0363394.1 hypothetical protein [Catenuloplanes indicus]